MDKRFRGRKRTARPFARRPRRTARPRLAVLGAIEDPADVYRSPAERSRATPPTVFTYRAFTVLLTAVLVIAVSFVLFLLVASVPQPATLSCTGGVEGGTCAARSYAVVALARVIELPARDLLDVAVEVRRGSKDGTYADVTLVTRDGKHPLPHGILRARVSPDSAAAAANAFREYRAGRTAGIDVWLTPPWGGWLAYLFSLVMLLPGVVTVYLLRRDLAPVRVVVDGDAGSVALPSVENPKVRLEEITGVLLEDGVARPAGAGKGDRLKGHRVVLALRDGRRAPVTDDFRVDRSRHETARATLEAILREHGAPIAAASPLA